MKSSVKDILTDWCENGCWANVTRLIGIFEQLPNIFKVCEATPSYFPINKDLDDKYAEHLKMVLKDDSC